MVKNSAVAKVGMNDRCPCGSGKKYKNCHNRVVKASATNLPSARTSEVRINPVGISGQLHHITFVAQFADPNDPRNSSGPSGQPGKYRVTFVFSRPGYPLLPQYQSRFSHDLQGDSQLAILPPAVLSSANEGATQVRIYVQSPTGQLVFDGYANNNGFLGKIVLESIDAQGFDEAELKAYRALAPTLSNWALHLDIPMHVSQTDSIELATGNGRTSMINPHVEAPFLIPGQGILSDELRRYASLYREALCSNSFAYQFLCFFKIIEGVYAKRRRNSGDARAQGRDARRYDERLPCDRPTCEAWLKAIFYVRSEWDPISLAEVLPDDVLGMKITRVVEQHLRKLRLEIAHAVLDSGEPTLTADDGLDLKRILKWLPLTRCIVRRILKDEFPGEFLPFLGEDGIVRATKS